MASEKALDSAQATFDVLEARLVALRDDVVVVEREIALGSQRVEVSLACRILNTMTSLGMPDSVKAE